MITEYSKKNVEYNESCYFTYFVEPSWDILYTTGDDSIHLFGIVLLTNNTSYLFYGKTRVKIMRKNMMIIIVIIIVDLSPRVDSAV